MLSAAPAGTFEYVTLSVSVSLVDGFNASVSTSPPRGGSARNQRGELVREALWTAANWSTPVVVTVALEQNGVAAEPFNVVSRLALTHKVAILRNVGGAEELVPARDLGVTAIDDDAPGVVSLTPDVFRAYELRVFEGDGGVDPAQRYELRATQCRVAPSSGAVGPLYSVRPLLIDAATELPVPSDVAELRLYEASRSNGAMVRVPASANGTIAIGGDAARFNENGCRAIVEVVVHRDRQPLGERLFIVRHTVTSNDAAVASLFGASSVCPLLALPRDIAVVVVDADQASVDVQPRFERVQVIEGRVSSSYSVRLTKRPLFPVRVAVRVDEAPTTNRMVKSTNGVISGGAKQVDVEPSEVVFTADDWFVLLCVLCCSYNDFAVHNRNVARSIEVRGILGLFVCIVCFSMRSAIHLRRKKQTADNFKDGNTIRAFATRQSIARRVRSPLKFAGGTGASFSLLAQRAVLLASAVERDAGSFAGPTIAGQVRIVVFLIVVLLLTRECARFPESCVSHRLVGRFGSRLARRHWADARRRSRRRARERHRVFAARRHRGRRAGAARRHAVVAAVCRV